MGFEEDLFVNTDKIPIRLFCGICLDVLEDAVETTCHHVFCRPCMIKLMKSKPECPSCRSFIDSKSLNKAVVLGQIIGDLTVYCSTEEQYRCGWTGPLSSLSSHLGKCTKSKDAQDREQAKLEREKDLMEEQERKELEEASGYTLERLAKLSLKRLLRLLASRNIKHDACLEKGDLVELVYKSLAAEREQAEKDRQKEMSRLSAMPIKKLIELLDRRGIDHAECVEKEDLVKLTYESRDRIDAKEVESPTIHEELASIPGVTQEQNRAPDPHYVVVIQPHGMGGFRRDMHEHQPRFRDGPGTATHADAQSSCCIIA